ncbi:MAG: GxxExxY protein [Kiritimatiellales bacterium]
MTQPTPHQEELARQFVDAALEVHRELGPGYDELLYENALAVELNLRGIPFNRQKTIKVFYKGIEVGEGRLDLLLDDELVVELKAVDELNPKHLAQVISYLKATELPLGLLVNFHVDLLKKGLKRVVYSSPS